MNATSTCQTSGLGQHKRALMPALHQSTTPMATWPYSAYKVKPPSSSTHRKNRLSFRSRMQDHCSIETSTLLGALSVRLPARPPTIFGMEPSNGVRYGRHRGLRHRTSTYLERTGDSYLGRRRPSSRCSAPPRGCQRGQRRCACLWREVDLERSVGAIDEEVVELSSPSRERRDRDRDRRERGREGETYHTRAKWRGCSWGKRSSCTC